MRVKQMRESNGDVKKVRERSEWAKRVKKKTTERKKARNKEAKHIHETVKKKLNSEVSGREKVRCEDEYWR